MNAAHVCTYNASYHDTWLLCNIFKGTDIGDEISWFDTSQANYCEWQPNVPSEDFDCADDVNITVFNIADYDSSSSSSSTINTSYSFPHLMTELALSGHALRGIFDFDSIAALTDLQTLNLANNALTGDISAVQWNTMLTQLSLTEFNIANNAFTSTAALSAASLTDDNLDLQYFAIHGNEEIGGTIDAQFFSHFPSLRNFSCHHNRALQASFDNFDFLASLPDLQAFEVHYTAMSGSIQFSADMSSSLSSEFVQVLNFEHTQFNYIDFDTLTGLSTLCSDAASLTDDNLDLQYFAIHGNEEIGGTIDAQFFSHFPSLRNFSCHHNRALQASFDNFDFLASLPDLQAFEVHYTAMSGSIQFSAQMASSSSSEFVQVLNFEHTQFEYIDFDTLTGLSTLDILTGLSTLQIFNAQHNPQLHGFIDWSVLSRLSHDSLTQLLLYNTSLTGFANFSGIADTLMVKMDERVLCDPSIYECPTGSSAASRSYHTCIGKADCESTCKCSDGSIAISNLDASSDGRDDDDSAWYTQLPFILSVSIGGGIVCCVLCALCIMYMLAKRAQKLNADTKQLASIQQLQGPSNGASQKGYKRSKRARTFSSIVSDTLGLGRTNPDREVLPPVPEQTEFDFPSPIDTNGSTNVNGAEDGTDAGAITPVQSATTPITPQEEIPDLDIAAANGGGDNIMKVRDDSVGADDDEDDDDDILAADPLPDDDLDREEEEEKAPSNIQKRYTITVEDFDVVKKESLKEENKRYMIRVDTVESHVPHDADADDDDNDDDVMDPDTNTEEEKKHAAGDEENVADIVSPADTILTMSAVTSNTAANDAPVRHPVLPEMTATAFNYGHDDEDLDITAADPTYDDPALPDDDDLHDQAYELQHAVSITDVEYLPHAVSITEVNETETDEVKEADS
eukprot:CAMPEP_0202733534 /NCGR_PEP_ID=MMETSP1385-20130828/188219_1 /ASSEMBLY_ACC=CAM_ASM_000861 /TAXON_ID=933848 /ORGANISM="Elphidium margaritaceum" /LENGTH=908 /DNA_ID=CAMNT_0049399871 /DNA_START=80 /DNA_END=2807 /DNA_ORIENTATION=+